MTACEECWGKAYTVAARTGQSQPDVYRGLLEQHHDHVVWQSVGCPTCHAVAGLACEDEHGYRHPDRPSHAARIAALNPT